MDEEDAIEAALIDEFDVTEEAPAEAKRRAAPYPDATATAAPLIGGALYPSIGDLPVYPSMRKSPQTTIRSSTESASHCSQRPQQTQAAEPQLSSTSQGAPVGVAAALSTLAPQTIVVSEAPKVIPEMTDEEFETQRRNIERELIVSRVRMDHLAHALMGDTPHQLEERGRRDHERAEREERRHHALEQRVLHQLERAHEREERRIKIARRASQASRSPSPEPHEIITHQSSHHSIT